MSWTFSEHSGPADTLRTLGQIQSPTLLMLATSDDHSPVDIRSAAKDVAPEPVRVELLEGYSHARWTDDQVEAIIRRTVDFLQTI